MVYRVVHGRHTNQKSQEGWYVEKVADGSGAQVASRLFETWLEAKAEADRLTRQGI